MAEKRTKYASHLFSSKLKRGGREGWKGGVGMGGYVFGKCRRTKTELRSCVKVQVAVAGSPSLIVLKVSVVVWQH